jgi:hypothetical protein
MSIGLVALVIVLGLVLEDFLGRSPPRSPVEPRKVPGKTKHRVVYGDLDVSQR